MSLARWCQYVAAFAATVLIVLVVAAQQPRAATPSPSANAANPEDTSPQELPSVPGTPEAAAPTSSAPPTSPGPVPAGPPRIPSETRAGAVAPVPAPASLAPPSGLTPPVPVGPPVTPPLPSATSAAPWRASNATSSPYGSPANRRTTTNVYRSPNPNEPMTMLQLRYRNENDASEVAHLVEQLFADRGVVVVADPRTSSVFIRCVPAIVEEVRKVAEQAGRPTADEGGISRPTAPAVPNSHPNPSVTVMAADSAGRMTAIPMMTGPMMGTMELMRDQPGEAESRQLAEEYLRHADQGSEGNRDEIKTKLRRAVEQSFQARQNSQRQEVEQLRERLRRVELQLEVREKQRDQIIDRRVEDLINPGQRWNPEQSASNGYPSGIQSRPVGVASNGMSAPAGVGFNSALAGIYGQGGFAPAPTPSVPSAPGAGYPPNPPSAPGMQLPGMSMRASGSMAGKPGMTGPTGGGGDRLNELSEGATILRGASDFSDKLQKAFDGLRAVQIAQENEGGHEAELRSAKKSFDAIRAELRAQVSLLESAVKEAELVVATLQSEQATAEEIAKRRTGSISATEVERLKLTTARGQARCDRMKALLKLYNEIVVPEILETNDGDGKESGAGPAPILPNR